MSPGNRSTIAKVRGSAERLGIDYRHFGGQRDPGIKMPFTAIPEPRFLRQAAASIAAAWFTRRGYAVSYPLETQAV